MPISSFLKLVEIQTKLASMVPFLLGTLYTLYRYDSFKWQNSIIMFVSLLSFDMATTAINNYFDFKKASDDHDYKKTNNVIGKDDLKEETVIFIIVGLLVLAVSFGIWLTVKTNIVILLIGMISFIVGILYTFGPIPLSRMPVGEIFSGFFMGFIILFLSIYIHIFDINILNIGFSGEMLILSVNIRETIFIFLMSVPLVCSIANIMLANNICDVEEDIVNKRFTLPYYIGKKNALRLFAGLYYIGFLDIILLIVLKISPVLMFLSLLAFIPVQRNIRIFFSNQSKKETFVLSVKNLLLLNIPQILIIGIAAVYDKII